jgi:predicted methyltransferase
MKARHVLLAIVTSALMSSGAAMLHAAQAVPPAVAAAVADTNRPAADTERDAMRRPAEMMAASGLKAGDKVIELVPGGGYVTRLISKIVGPMGHVYAANLPSFNERFKTGVLAVTGNPAYGNVSVLEMSFAELKAPEPVDVVWTSENYHDYKNMGMFNTDTNAMNRAIFAALKPGGRYIVTDYVAVAGSGVRDTQMLHRIDPAVIRSEVTAAGFTLESQSNALAHPDDPHTGRSGQASDQVYFVFRKPG